MAVYTLGEYAELKKKKKKNDDPNIMTLEEYAKRKKMRSTALDSDDIAPIGQSGKNTIDIAPVKTTESHSPISKKIDSLMTVSNSKDFHKKSGYVSTKSDGFWEKLGSKYGMGYNDLQYEYINNQNGMRDEIDRKALSWGSDTGKTSSSYKEKALEYMTDDEVAVYNYYYQTEGKDKAQEFLDALSETLSERKAGKDFSNFEGKVAREILFGAVAGTEQFKQGVKSFGKMVSGKDDYIPQTSTQILSGKIREDLSDDGANILGNSVGQLGYDVLNSGANALPSIAVGAATFNPAIGAAVMGASASGNAYQQELNEGNDKDKAKIYATTIGALEGTLQYFLGGIGKLGGTSKVLNNAVSGVKNGALRFSLEYGGKIGSEALEEGLQEVLNPVVKNAVYGTDESVNWEEVAYSALLGGLMGGVFGASEVSNTHLNTNEHTVVEKEIENRIKEKETGGKKLDKKEKAVIRKEVMSDLEKGRISIDTIESVLGGETYNNLKSATGEETKLREEFNELNKLKLGEMTGEQTDRKAELKKQLDELKNTSKISEIRSRLDSEMSKAVEGTKLAESYNERSRRGQGLEVDVESYKSENAKQTAQNFKDFGANNSNAAHDYLDLVTKVAEDRGHTFKFMTTKQLEESIKNGKTYNITEDAGRVEAFVSGNTKEIIINMDANKTLSSLVGHEVMHTLEKANSYSDVQNVLFEYAKTKGEYDERLASVQRRYSNLTEEQQVQELTADLVGDYVFGDTDFVRNLSTEKPNIFKKIYNEIKYLWNMATAGSKEKRELERVKKEFDRIWRESSNGISETKYSLEETSDGIEYVKAEKDLFLKEDGTMLSEREIFNSLVGKTFAFPDGEVKIMKRLPDKDMYNELSKRRPRHKGVPDIKKLNSDVNKNMEELLANSDAKTLNIPDVNNRHAKYGITAFDTRKVKFYDGTNAYDIEFSIATLENGEKVAYAKKFFGYDDVLTKKIQDSEARSQSPLNQNPVHSGSITQNSEKASGNIRFSLSEEVENVSDRLSMSEWRQVQSAVADYTKRNYHYEKSANGDIIVPINNKLVYTDANYGSPGISKIIEFESEYEDDIDFARKELYAVEKGKSTNEEAYEIIRLFTGIENINQYEAKNRTNVGKYDRRTGRGKSQSDSYHSNFLQERIRRANEIINSVNSNATENSEASSKDGVFFDAKKRIADDDSYTSKAYGNHIYAKDVVRDDVSDIAPTQEHIPVESGTGPVQEVTGTVADEEGSEHIAGEDLTKRNADRIRTLQAEIQGHKLTRDITKKEFNQKIAKKEAEYEALKRKDTQKAVFLRNQITNLKTRKDSLLNLLDNKIERANKRIERIENESRYEKRKTKLQQYRELFGRLIGDTSTWKDKKFGIWYQTNTLRRNLRDIVRDENGKPDIARADAICDELQGSVNRNEAKKNREANEIKDAFRKMKINHTESTYIQMLGELRHNPDTTLTQEIVDDFYEKNKKKIDAQKVDRAIEEARKLYDSLYDRVNAALREHGFKEIGYRKGYFPHFTEPKQNWLAKLLNWKVNKDEIPTDIAGLTEAFEPQRTWQSFNQHRRGDTTDYNFLKGLDNYVDGALDWVYHIGDIQKHRAFETEIRYRHSGEEIQKKIDEYRSNPMLSAEEVETLIQGVLKEAQNPLNNFVTDLHTRTNILAGKKSSKDRNMESDFNRHAYSVMTNVTNRVTANQVVGSISSALTNFIPITQSWGQVKPTSSLVGMKKTIQSYMCDDGVIEKSDFLTNRLAQNEALYKDAWDKAGDIVGVLMEIVDNFTSQTVWRSKYYENIKNGMTEAQAVKDADQFAENVIAGRSKGNMPTIFHAKNPVSKMLTSFQLEVANQYGYMFKDMPQDIGNKAMGNLVKGYVTMFVGAYAYNALYATFTGRDSAFDPIGIIGEFIRDLTGDDEEEEKDVAGAIGNLASNVADEIPFVGGLLGGGRIPISSALPYNASIPDAYADVVEGDWKAVLDELSKPLYYGVLPMGGGQIRKTVQGLSMFRDELPVSGSYTKSGNLRFPVEDTFLNKLQAGVFGQYAGKNAREYFDRGQAPLKEKQIQEYLDVDLPISEYWDYREGMKDLSKLSDKMDYINSLDLPVAKKNILANNQTDREVPINLNGFDDRYENFEEFDFATRYPEKYKVLQEQGISVKDYKENHEETAFIYTDDYSWAADNPKKYAISKIFSDDLKVYKQYTGELNAIKGDEQKKKKTDYINGLNLDYGQKIILYRSLYDSKADKENYNADILEYLNSREDISHEERVAILETLDFKVYPDGTVKW